VGKVDAKDEMPAVPANLKEITHPATLIYFFRFAQVIRIVHGYYPSQFSAENEAREEGRVHRQKF